MLFVSILLYHYFHFQLYAEKIYVSYLSLLLNSRSEISLARALNVPDRELNHEAFTRLKKAAGEKRMPMFQVRNLVCHLFCHGCKIC